MAFPLNEIWVQRPRLARCLLVILSVALLMLVAVSAVADNSGEHRAPDPVAAPVAPSIDTGVIHTHVLENGLRIFVRQDHRAPVVVSQLWYQVGASYEPLGQTGVSHLLEHLMFKGTQRVPPGHFSKVVDLYGGKDNAFTHRDYTGYYQIWHKSRLPISFELEADRMQHLRLTPVEFERELKVVMEERRLRTDDQPTGKAYEYFLEAAYVSSPYGQPVVGWMHDLETLQLSQVEAWYQAWYAPNNANLVVVGDVVPEEVFALAQRFFGEIPQRDLPVRPSAIEVRPVGEKRLSLHTGVKVEELFMAFNVPRLVPGDQSWEAYALMLLASVLDGGFSARFETRLVREQAIAASISAGYSGLARGSTQFMINAIAAKGHSLEDLEQAIFAEIQDIQTNLVEAEEVNRVLAQLLSSRTFQQDSIATQAKQIGQLAVIGYPVTLADELPEALAEITPAQIQSVAQRYLNRTRLTLARLLPD